MCREPSGGGTGPSAGALAGSAPGLPAWTGGSTRLTTVSAAGGVVTFAGEQPGYGLVVKVDHGDGLETRYAHLSSALVAAGSPVEAGSPIARLTSVRPSGESTATTSPRRSSPKR